MEGLGEAIVGLIDVAATAVIIKEFMDPKTGKSTEYELHETFDNKGEASQEASKMRADGHKAMFKRQGDKFNVWIAKRASNMMKWPYN